MGITIGAGTGFEMLVTVDGIGNNNSCDNADNATKCYLSSNGYY